MAWGTAWPRIRLYPLVLPLEGVHGVWGLAVPPPRAVVISDNPVFICDVLMIAQVSAGHSVVP